MQSQSGRKRISAYPKKILYTYRSVFYYFVLILLLSASDSGHLRTPSSSQCCRVGRAAGEKNSIIHINAVKEIYTSHLCCSIKGLYGSTGGKRQGFLNAYTSLVISLKD